MKKKDEVIKDFHDLCGGSVRCIDRRRCSGCRDLASLKSSQIFAAPPPAPSQDLKPIQLKDVIQDLYRRARNSQKLLQDNKTLLARCYEQRSLVASLCVDAARKSHSALSVIEADDGTACILQVFHAAQSVARGEELRRLLPRGIRVVIARPSVGCLHPAVSPVVIYVESPASLDFVRGAPPPPPKLLAMAPRDLRRDGNALFAQGSYLLAIQCYTQCAARVEMEKEASDRSEAVLAVSNRAEAWLKLGMFDRAIADASAAIAMDPLHAKSFYRRGRALMAVQEHVEARASLKAAARHAGDGESRKEIVDALARCKIFLAQSQKGAFDVGDYVSSGCNLDRAPRCSDFVGPIEIRLTRDGRGRGLFLTKKARLGDLLLVANNVSFAVAKNADDARSDLVAGALRAAAASRRVLAQLYAIEDAAALPSIKLFRPNLGHHCEAAGSDPDAAAIDVARIQRAVAAGAFPWSILGQADSSKSRVWALPALINHSCLPNVSKLEVGKATMFHAARDLHVGDELLISYVDPFVPWSSDRRRSLAEGWGFECSCRRCCLERRHSDLFRDVLPPDLAALDTIDKCTGLLLAMEDRLARTSGLSEDEKDLFRVTLFDFYGPFSAGAKKALEWTKSSAASSGSAMAALHTITPDRLFRLLRATAPGHPKTLVYMSYLARCRDSNSDVCHFLVDEFTAAYGSQCACLVWKVLQTYFEAALENFMEVGGAVEYRICKCWFSDDKGCGFRVECLL